MILCKRVLVLYVGAVCIMMMMMSPAMTASRNTTTPTRWTDQIDEDWYQVRYQVPGTILDW